MARLWRGAAGVLLLVAVNSCGLGDAGGSAVEKDGYFVLVAPKERSEAGVGYGTTRLRLVDDCVGLDLGDGTVAVAIWPHGTKWVSTDPLTIDVPGLGRVEEGDGLVGGGADYKGPHPMSGIDVPTGCRDARVVSFTPDQ